MINKLLMVETGTYNDQVLRPYKTNLDPHNMMQFQEATAGGTVLTAQAVGNVSGSILRPDGQVRGAANIANGWGERRMRFLIEVDYDTGYGSVSSFIVTGYTDYTGVTMNGSIDPNMQLYFNNCVQTRSVQRMTPVGNVWHQAVVDASQILPFAEQVPVYQPQANYHTPNVLANGLPHMLRPVDIVNGMQTNLLGDPELIDLRTVNPSGTIKKSRRSNGNSAEYLSRTLTALDTGEKLHHDDHTADYGMFMETAKTSLNEGMISNDMFFMELSMKTMYNNNGFITWAEFCRLHPEADSMAEVFLKGEVQKRQSITAERGTTEHWIGSNNETIAATLLAHAVPAIMMDQMLTKVTFVATNQTLNGQMMVDIRQASSFSKNVEMGPYLQAFVTRLQMEVLKDVSRSDQFTVQLQMLVDVMGDTYITISLNGGPSIDYVIPSFCDALVAPVIGGSQMDVDVIAHDISQLYGCRSATYNEPPMQQQQSYNSNYEENNNGGFARGTIDILL